MTELKVGMRLFHKNQMGVVRECEIIKIYNDNGIEKVDVKLFEKVMVKSDNVVMDTFCGISSRSIGKVLFFEKEDTELSTTELADRLDYIDYGNHEIIKKLKEKEEEIKREEEISRIKQKRQEREIKSITEIIEERNINYLVYFTRFENLKSILQNGIVPEMHHSKMNICSIKNICKKRYIFQVEGNGYSVEFPNYKLLTLLREGGKHTDRYVMLRLDAKSVLLDTIGQHVYCADNALTSGIKYYEEGFKKLFLGTYSKEAYEYNNELQKGIEVKREDLDIPSYYTTNPQAEIEICSIVGPKYIKQIVFENGNDKQMWLENNCESQNSSVDFVIDASLFGPRIDYKFWQ